VSSVQERLWDRIDPYLSAEGVELDDVEVLGGGQIVRVTVDAQDSLGVDMIADLSRGISRLLDEEDPVKGPYTLEVSSPGLERKLRRPRHYDKSVGKDIRVKTHAEIDGARNHRGSLVASDTTGFTIEVDGSERNIPYGDVASARTVFVWDKGESPRKDS
jgi:ribosome maturation factor RimP